MKMPGVLISVSANLILLFLLGCKQEAESGISNYELRRIERQKLEGAVVSKILELDDSSFHPRPLIDWKARLSHGHKWHVPEPRRRDTSGKHIYLGIVDRYSPARSLGDSSFLDLNFSRFGMDKELFKLYPENTDRSTFEMPLQIKHRYVFVKEEDYKKPHLSLKDMPEKYVRNFCRIRLSRPTFNRLRTESLTYYENHCSGKGAVYYSRLTEGGWKVIGQSPTIWQAEIGCP